MPCTLPEGMRQVIIMQEVSSIGKRRSTRGGQSSRVVNCKIATDDILPCRGENSSATAGIQVLVSQTGRVRVLLQESLTGTKTLGKISADLGDRSIEKTDQLRAGFKSAMNVFLA